VREVGATEFLQSPAGIGLDNRIGSKFLHADRGMGARAFPRYGGVDQDGQDYEAPVRIVETVAAVNEARKRGMFRKIGGAGRQPARQTIAVSAYFKPNTDDMPTPPRSR